MFLDAPWPWFISGALIFGGLVWLLFWTRQKNYSISWYEWIIGAIGIAILFFTVQNFWAAFEEYENTAAWWYLVVFGVPSVMIIAIAVRLAIIRNSKAKAT